MDNQSLVIIGATLVTFPLSMLTYYGNLLPYLASYFQAHRDSMTMYLDPLWPSTAFRCFLPVSMMFTTPLERWLGARTCISVGVAALCVCVLSGFFSVDEPVALTIIFGALHGLSVGLIYPLTSKLLLDTVSGPGGLASGIMSIGPALGSLVNIGLAYAVVNPTNKKADLEKGKTFYFSDPDIIKNVPYYFLVTGAVTAFTTVLGTLLLIIGSGRTNTKSEKNRSAEVSEAFDGKKYGSCSQRDNSNSRCNCTLDSNIGKDMFILSDPERSTHRPDEKVCTHKENCSDGCSKRKNIESPPHATKTKVEASFLNIEGKLDADGENKLYEVLPNLVKTPAKEVKEPVEKQEMVMCRLRVGQSWLTQNYLFKNGEQLLFCYVCDSLYTVQQILVEWQDFQITRSKYYNVIDLY
ncbi:transporter, major facilitator family protein [Plakobranchus ocellatus]|uniref:Transporter, major facilitator family protein n=1 Tax=Plakobranchus ocellatus TaxID=259542 RepID=A0AAV4ANN6_9GAST|nr:transporter, major facilitator family protein [Plakobranchus ocellatus]